VERIKKVFDIVLDTIRPYLQQHLAGKEVHFMERDINTFEINEMLFAKLKKSYGDLKEVPSKMPAMDKMGETKWYGPGEKAHISFRKQRGHVLKVE